MGKFEACKPHRTEILLKFYETQRSGRISHYLNESLFDFDFNEGC